MKPNVIFQWTRITVWSIMLIGLGAVSPVVASGSENQPADPGIGFADIDGDGFNDHDPDLNSNGIPDRLETPAKTEPIEDSGILGQSLSEMPAPRVYLNNRSACLAREFCVRGYSFHRAGFIGGESFGPGSGIGIGNLAGGCEGGVCVIR